MMACGDRLGGGERGMWHEYRLLDGTSVHLMGVRLDSLDAVRDALMERFPWLDEFEMIWDSSGSRLVLSAGTSL